MSDYNQEVKNLLAKGYKITEETPEYYKLTKGGSIIIHILLFIISLGIGNIIYYFLSKKTQIISKTQDGDLPVTNKPTNHVRMQIDSLGLPKVILISPEIPELENLIQENESITAIVQGVYQGGRGLLVSTNTRVLFVDKSMLKLRVQDFMLNKISSIQYQIGIAFTDINIIMGGDNAIIKNVEKVSGQAFCEKLKAKLSTHA